MKRLIPILAVVALAGCATLPPVAPPEVQIIDQPALNQVASAEIGETLLAKGKLYVFEGLELQERITDNGIAREYVVEAHALRLDRKDPAGVKFFTAAPGAYYVNDKSFGRKATPTNAYLLKKPDGSLELTGYYDLSTAGKISPAEPRHREGKLVDRGQPNFRQELIYGGRVGSQIKVTYREFSGDMIRPGFTQEAQYDLASDSTIGFKGVRVEVIEATNTRLTYRVLKSFPDSM